MWFLTCFSQSTNKTLRNLRSLEPEDMLFGQRSAINNTAAEEMIEAPSTSAEQRSPDSRFRRRSNCKFKKRIRLRVESPESDG